ncbi:uncharacterized protein LOC135476821 [Liolophura sinensis]|uniref:uncharacterized protein LOC135476821 n=1 Tax=Liolophura sinensis TaxID=3198878 RepID=UPI003158FE79
MQSSPERNRHGTISVPFTRVRTRSMTSVESKDTDSSVKLKTIDGISLSQKNNGKPEEGLTESPSHMTRQRSHGDKSSPCWSLTESPSHMTRQRCHGDKSSPCRLCAEPHSDSTCGTAALPSGDDVEHSASKKTKRTLEKEFPEKETRSKMATNTEGRRPSPTSKVRSQAGSRRSLAQRKSLSVTKSKKYQTRSRSGV